MQEGDFERIDRLFCQLVDRKKISGTGSLTIAEQTVLLLWHASGIIENGGLQYFYEQSLDAEAVAAAYERIGCPECAEALRLSQSLFPNAVVPADWDERIKFVEEHSDLFEKLSARFSDSDKKMPSRLAKYLRKHGGLE